MLVKYILNDKGKPIREKNLYKWCHWMGTSDEQRIVKQEMVGKSKVSTVFLSLDYRWGKGPPILWETMVFGGKLDREQDRCSGNREQAEAMHERMVARVKKGQK